MRFLAVVGAVVVAVIGFGIVEGLKIESGDWYYKPSMNPILDKSSSAGMLSSKNKDVVNGLNQVEDRPVISVLNPNTSIVITSPDASFACEDVCEITVSVDGAPEQRITVQRAETEPNVLRIQNPAAFAATMERSSTLRVNLPITNKGEVPFTYKVSGFDSARFKKT